MLLMLNQDYQNLINADFNNDYINALSDILREIDLVILMNTKV